MAKYQGAVLDLPMTACGDLGAYQYHFVRTASTNGRVQLANGSSGPMPLGILQNDPRDLEEATVRVMGTSKVMISGSIAISYGDFLSCMSTGHAELHVSTSGSRASQGICLEDVKRSDSTTTNVYGEILLFPLSVNVTDQTP